MLGLGLANALGSGLLLGLGAEHRIAFLIGQRLEGDFLLQQLLRQVRQFIRHDAGQYGKLRQGRTVLGAILFQRGVHPGDAGLRL